jgi:hypothetical protein
MWRLSKQARNSILICSALLIAFVGFVEFAMWHMSRVSPAFFSASQTAYRSIRECDDKISEGNPTFVSCVEKAQNAVTVLGKTAVTQQERLNYAFLHGYLNAVDDCHRDWLSSDGSADAKAREEQLVRFRTHMEKSYK